MHSNRAPALTACAELNESHKNARQIVQRENVLIYNLDFERIKDKESSIDETFHGQVVI
jgi:hypothetical protein